MQEKQNKEVTLVLSADRPPCLKHLPVHLQRVDKEGDKSDSSENIIYHSDYSSVFI